MSSGATQWKALTQWKTLTQWKAQFEREEGEGEEVAGEPGDV